MHGFQTSGKIDNEFGGGTLDLEQFEREWTAKARNLFLRMQRLLEQVQEDCGVTLAQSYVLGELVRSGEMTMSALSQKLQVTKGNLSSLCNRMERQGLVQRKRSEKDERVVYIDVTRSSRELIERTWQEHDRFYQFRGQDTSEELQHRVLDGLQAMDEYLSICEEQYHQFFNHEEVV